MWNTKTKKKFEHAGELVNSIIENGKLSELLTMKEFKGGNEQDWLEYKAAFIPDESQQEEDRIKKGWKNNIGPDTYKWMVLKAIISMINTRGGCVIIGVQDDGQVNGIGLEVTKDLVRKHILSPLNGITLLGSTGSKLRVRHSDNKVVYISVITPFNIDSYVKAEIVPVTDKYGINKNIVVLVIIPDKVRFLVTKQFEGNECQPVQGVWSRLPNGGECKFESDLDIISNNLQRRNCSLGSNSSYVDSTYTKLEVIWKKINRIDRLHKRKQLIVGVVLISFFAIFFPLSRFYYNRTEITFYADYVDRYGIPEGVVKLDTAQIKKRNTHYRFEESRGKLREVIYANSVGVPVDHNNTEFIDRPSILSFHYSGDNLTNTELKNSKGKVIVVYSWGGDHDRIDLKNDKSNESSATLAASFTSITSNLFEGRMFRPKAEIKRYKLTRDENGYITQREFKRFNGEDDVASDISGVSGFEYKLDSLGRIVEMFYLGYDGEKYRRQTDMIGVMGRRYEYDNYGNISRVEYFGKDYQPTLNEQLWAICIEISDEDGNIIERTYYDTEGNLYLNKNGYAKVKTIYDDKGNIIEEEYFDTDGEKCFHNDGYAKYKAKYDNKGYQTEISSFDADGKLSLHNNGYAKIKFLYDNRGNLIEAAFYDTDENLSLNNYGFAKGKLKYDDKGNIIEEEYFDTDGEKCFHKDGYAKVSVEYDDRGNLTEKAFYGTDGKLIFHNEGEFAKITISYDKKTGNQTEYLIYDTDGKLIKDGLAKWNMEYDARGNQTEIRLYDAAGDLLEGVAKIKFGYNTKSGMLNEVTFYDAHDELYESDEDGFAKVTINIKFDDQRNIIELNFYDSDGEKCFNKDRYSKLIQITDKRGNLVEEAYYGADGKPILNNEGIAKWTAEYDERGNQTEEAYYGTDGKLTLNNEGIAKWTAKYDDRGNQIGKTHYDAVGNQIRHMIPGNINELRKMIRDVKDESLKFFVHSNSAELDNVIRAA